jgi:threonine-phosphate decarboxylase
MIHGHGNDIHQHKNKIDHDFSSNVVCSGMAVELADHLASCISNIENYPEPDAFSLRCAIAEKHDINPCNVIVTNGSTEAFYLLAQAFSKRQSVIAIPAFAEYEDAAVANNHSVEFCNYDDVTNTKFSGTDILWIGNPNNPVGQTLSSDEIVQLCVSHPNMLVVVDEAYGELCINFKSPLQTGSIPTNLIITRSLTKTFSIPGIRLGYLIASEEICRKINRIKMPWNVNTLAIEAGLFIMKNHYSLSPDIDKIIEESKWLQNELAKSDSIKTLESNCNFFLAELLAGDAALLKEHLLTNHGILIRDASNFRGLTSMHFRIAARTRTENLLLINAIKTWMQQL